MKLGKWSFVWPCLFTLNEHLQRLVGVGLVTVLSGLFGVPTEIGFPCPGLEIDMAPTRTWTSMAK